MRLAAVLVALALLGAGCLDDDDPETQQTDGSSELIQSLLGNATATIEPVSSETTWWIGAAPAPAGNGSYALAGFRWTVPDHVDGYNGFDGEILGDELDHASLLVFRMEDGEAHFAGGVVDMEICAAVRQAPMMSTSSGCSDEGDLSVSSTIGFEPEDGLVAGTEYGFVLAAKTGPAPFGLAFTVYQEDDDGIEFDFGTGAAMPLVGTGSGFEVPLYLDINGMIFGLPGYGMEFWTKDITIDRTSLDLRPQASVGPVALSSDFESDAGSGFMVALYAGSAGQSSWAIDVELFNQTLRDAGTGRPTYGAAIYALAGEGPRGASGSFVYNPISVNLFELVLYLEIDLGATLTELLGGPWSQDHGIVDGTEDAQRPTVARDGDDLLITHPSGGLLTFAGALAGT
ncbi:MAG: hypothetical protein ACPGQL_10045 [Thermoplasmatota archaeon]